jgi:chromosome segregation protein
MIKRLLSLELQGIKTFATMSRLEFPGQITAIVGPNGSGKSNIADSVRWVLGEQAYSVLRARKTDDMIFSGSEQRSRSGMATATITFDNHDGWLPIDYSEVTISRRAYRDGQNEYLLNGQKVRLRDISELLAQTGLSERTYTIIGQGLVDVALGLKPDERRNLFEEAAGIGLYQSRKEEAQRRLENTRKNLDRILDIMTEIKPRLRSLERQAARFIEYDEIRSNLNSLLRDWYGYHWYQKQADLIKSREAFQNHETLFIELQKRHKKTGSEVEQKRFELQNIRKELQGAYAELSSFNQSLEQITRELAVLDERQRSYSQQKSNLEIDVANAEEELAELKSQEDAFKDEIEQKSSEFESANVQVKQVEARLAEMVEQKEIIEAKMGSIRSKRLSLDTKKVQLTARINEIEYRISSQNIEKQKIIEAVQHLEREIQKSDQRMDDLERVQTEKAAALVSLEDELNKVIATLQDLEIDQQALQVALNEKETSYAKLTAQIDVLTQAEAALQGYSEGSKKIVENSRSGKLPQGIEPLSRHMLVDEKYEKAIGAALGELADLLILPSGERDIVIQYLETKENDRVALVPIDQVNGGKNTSKLRTSDGIIGYANELIDVQPKYKKLVDQLLSDTVIVKDSLTALQIQPQLNQFEKVVTLNGIVFQANGVMLSGQSASGKRVGRTRQQSEMKAELGRLGAQIEELNKQKLSLTQKTELISKNKERLTEERKLLDSEKKTAETNCQDAIETLRRLREQLNWHQTQLENMKKSLDEAQNTIQLSQNELVEIMAQIDQLSTSEREIASELEELSVFELQQDLNYWQTHQIVTKNGLESARQRNTDHLKRIDDASLRLSTYRLRTDDIESQLIEISNKKNTLSGQSNEVNAAIEKLRSERIDTRNKYVEELTSEVLMLEGEEAQTHQQVLDGERQSTQLQLEVSRQEDHLNLLIGRIEDDFNLVSPGFDGEGDGSDAMSTGETLINKLPKILEIPDSIDEDIRRLKYSLRKIGAVNPEAQKEYLEVKERFDFLTNQISDLESASEDLYEVIEKLDEKMSRDFVGTVNSVNEAFGDYFKRLFTGGEAQIKFSDEDNPVEGGIDIEVRLPGRRRQELSLLSGGERSLTAVALIFALLKVSPTPFCILDEADAMLDESNVGRFIELLKELAQKIQFVIITHNRNTVQAADVIYGVTMGRDSTSQMISLKLEDVDESYLE